MDIYELVEIGLAGVDRDLVDIAELEPVEVAAEGVAGLSAIVAQLAYNATELLSGVGDKVSITGGFDRDWYGLSITDHGMGISDAFLEGLNQILANPRHPGEGTTASGVQLVAGLAARHEIWVRLEHAHPGVTAKVKIPPRLLHDRRPVIADSAVVFPDQPEEVEELTLSKPLDIDTEEFLESVFGPLREGTVAAVTGPGGTGVAPVLIDSGPEATTLVMPETAEPSEPLTGFRRTRLRTRVPGHHYSQSDQGPSHTKPGEAAVEIKLALDDFTRGRQAAAGSDEAEETG